MNGSCAGGILFLLQLILITILSVIIVTENVKFYLSTISNNSCLQPGYTQSKDRKKKCLDKETKGGISSYSVKLFATSSRAYFRMFSEQSTV